jgi:hypothetical protein
VLRRGESVACSSFQSSCARDLSIRGGNEDTKMKIEKPAKQRPAVKTRRKVRWLKVIFGAVRWIGLAFTLIDKLWPRISESVRDMF